MLVTLPKCRGFSLVEMVVVISITGILGAMLAMLIKGPVQGYVDSAQRAGMTDEADTAFHRLMRDVRLALPNSVRVWGALSGSGSCNGAETCYMEYLEMIAGGRYNTSAASCFDTASMVSGGVGCLTSIGDLVAGGAGSSSSVLLNGRGSLSASAIVVINNQDNNSSGTCAASSVYCGYGNGLGYGGAAITGGVVANSGVAAADDVINFAPTRFTPPSSNRFQIVDTPVTYACNPAAGTITRYWNYPVQATQPHAAASFSGAASAVLASHVSSCSYAYKSIVDAAGQSAVLVNMPMIIRRQDAGQGQADTLTLYGTVYVGSESSVYGGAHGGLP